ncbi:unnamed protein product [Pipistrellus nathusii]|uniref:Uncharacterized protein n=1 Tax=Pipistrellus nathusii TaxID=59473 RepID=A0ABN9Z7C8_PIPNA
MSPRGSSPLLANIQSCLGKEREFQSLSTKCASALLDLIFSHPSPGPPPELTLLPGKCRVWAEKGIWDLVPGRSPIGWHWAHLKVLNICQCVSQALGYEGWILPTQRTQGQHTVFLVIEFDSLGS